MQLLLFHSNKNTWSKINRMMKHTDLKKLISLSAYFLLFCVSICFASGTTIYANPNFKNEVCIAAGQNYDSLDPRLSFKMIDQVNNTGLFSSLEGSIVYIITKQVESLPDGLRWGEVVNFRYPTSNTFYIYGKLAENFPKGTYPVAMTGEDGVRRGHFATQIIKLNVTDDCEIDKPPYATQSLLIVNALVGDQVNVDIKNKFATYPDSSNIDSYTIQGELPAGVVFANGVFTGNYSQEQQLDLQVLAHNSAKRNNGWSSNNLTVKFNITSTDSPPKPQSTHVIINDKVGNLVKVDNVSRYFTMTRTSSPITEYKLVDSTKLPPDSSFTTTGDFQGSYTRAGVFSVNVLAKNNSEINGGWSTDSLIIDFNITAIPVVPSTTLLCPSVEKIRRCQPSAIVEDSDGNPYTFVLKQCQGEISYLSKVSLNQPGKSDGVFACIYLTPTIPAGNNIEYVLNPAPARSYLGVDSSNTAGDCSESRETCGLKIPK